MEAIEEDHVSVAERMDAAERLVAGVYGTADLSLDAAFAISEADIKHVNTIAGSQKAVNYGEVPNSTWSEVLNRLQLKTDDVFYDLGSGRGALAMFTHVACKLRKSVGIELSRERHTMAIRALQSLRSASPAACAGLYFLNEDIRHADFRDATCVFLMNQDMPHRLVGAVWAKLLELGQPLTVVTLHAPRDLPRLPERETISGLPQTWNQSTDFHIYRLPGAANAVAMQASSNTASLSPEGA